MAEKMFRVRIKAKDAEALRALPIAEMDTTCMGGVRALEDGTVEFDALADEAVLKKIRARRAKVEVLADLAEEAKKKHKQVGRGNRFEGDDWIPRGPGRKVREEGQR